MAAESQALLGVHPGRLQPGCHSQTSFHIAAEAIHMTRSPCKGPSRSRLSSRWGRRSWRASRFASSAAGSPASTTLCQSSIFQVTFPVAHVWVLVGVVGPGARGLQRRGVASQQRHDLRGGRPRRSLLAQAHVHQVRNALRAVVRHPAAASRMMSWGTLGRCSDSSCRCRRKSCSCILTHQLRGNEKAQLGSATKTSAREQWEAQLFARSHAHLSGRMRPRCGASPVTSSQSTTP